MKSILSLASEEKGKYGRFFDSKQKAYRKDCLSHESNIDAFIVDLAGAYDVFEKIGWGSEADTGSTKLRFHLDMWKGSSLDKEEKFKESAVNLGKFLHLIWNTSKEGLLAKETDILEKAKKSFARLAAANPGIKQKLEYLRDALGKSAVPDEVLLAGNASVVLETLEKDTAKLDLTL